MDLPVPYMPSTKNVSAILDAMQKAAVPESFGNQFLKDLGFTSSNDRPIIKLLKYLGLLDGSGKPQTPYREFVNPQKGKVVLAEQLTKSYDDLFASNKDAHKKSASDLKGWFKTKTGAGDSVAEKMAATFKSLAEYATIDEYYRLEQSTPGDEGAKPDASDDARDYSDRERAAGSIGLVYRFEIHLPDTQNVETFRAIFKAMREELL